MRPCHLSSTVLLVYQCFDLDAYLAVNARKPTWMCPVCLYGY